MSDSDRMGAVPDTAASGALVSLSLTEVAVRINAHLQRLEGEEMARRKAAGTDRDLGGSFYFAGASRSGAYVTVQYIAYQGSANLTRAEALHYLAALDAGYQGRHADLFRKTPPPAPADDVRFVALVRDRFSFMLYAVTKRTATRVYGHKVAGEGYLPSWVDRSQVLKLQATEDDLRRVLAAQELMRERKAEAERAFRRTLDEICGREEAE